MKSNFQQERNLAVKGGQFISLYNDIYCFFLFVRFIGYTIATCIVLNSISQIYFLICYTIDVVILYNCCFGHLVYLGVLYLLN